MLKKIKQTNLYNNLFGFENNIDINDDVAVLFRKNVVIKNIVLISNFIYTIIFTIVSIDEKSNWFLTALCLPVTFLVNNTLKKMMYRDKNNYLRQQIAMYICCFYMFLSAILIYTRLKTGLSSDFFGEAGYILLYYSLVVCSFYQSKKLLKSVYPWVIVLITIIHFSITYNILFDRDIVSNENYIITFFTSSEFKDILLRTAIMLVFMLVLYISVSVTEYLAEQRKKELARRQEVENSYTDVVSNLFKLTLNPKPRTKSEVDEGMLLANMSYKLAGLYGLDDNKALDIKRYANIHLVAKVDLEIGEVANSEEKFNKIEERTKLASFVLKRLQLERKIEDIIRAHLEGANTTDFQDRMVKFENDIENQIVMLCDMYISLRSSRTYKRAISHTNTMDLLANSFRIYYDAILFERFLKFQDDFKEMYDNYEV